MKREEVQFEIKCFVANNTICTNICR